MYCKEILFLFGYSLTVVYLISNICRHFSSWSFFLMCIHTLIFQSEQAANTSSEQQNWPALSFELFEVGISEVKVCCYCDLIIFQILPDILVNLQEKGFTWSRITLQHMLQKQPMNEHYCDHHLARQVDNTLIYSSDIVNHPFPIWCLPIILFTPFQHRWSLPG